MPYGSATQKKMLAKIILIIAALLLIFGQVPILGWSITMSLFAGFSFGTLIGIVILYVVWLLHKNEV